jgi:hypothetical protein
MAALPGLTSLYGLPTPGDDAHGMTGRPASNWGGPPDRRHSIPGDSSKQADYDQPIPVYGTAIEGGSHDELIAAPLPGMSSDQTPDVHSAPYPRGIGAGYDPKDPYALQNAATQMRMLHGRDLGGVKETYEVATPYEQHLVANGGLFTASPNKDELDHAVPTQLRSGSDDVDQGYGSSNQYGFQYGRLIKRWFGDNIPLDRTATSGGERPFYGHHPVWQNRLDRDSQFGAYGDISVGMNMADTPTGTPTPYEQPPNPTYRATTDYPMDSEFAGGWVAG